MNMFNLNKSKIFFKFSKANLILMNDFQFIQGNALRFKDFES
jgi:hypothetical protein